MHAGPKRSELLDRAKQMRERIASRVDEAEDRRRLSEATISDFVEAGFFSVLVPKRFGGSEMRLDALLDLVVEIGEVCGSSAWVLALFGIHNWLAALFPEETQEELFAGNGYVLAPATFAPGGRLRSCPGGFRLEGRWSFGSGCHHGSWVFVSALAEGGDSSTPEIRCAAVPIERVQIEDTWHTSGMRGTGSADLVIEETFVPKERTIDFAGLLAGNSPGSRIHAAPSFRLPLVPVLALVATAPAVGLAKGALAAFRDRVQPRNREGEGIAATSAPTQIRLAEASMEVAAAEGLLRGTVDSLLDRNEAGEELSLNDRAYFRMAACYATTLCVRSVDRVVAAAGARAQFRDSPLQRQQRDIQTLRGHIVFDFDATAELYGRTLLGLAPNQALV